MLLCPVRDCRMPLARDDRRLFCAQGHSFDVARSGYINLLQPQDRRSSQPGDTMAAVRARRRLHDRGVTKPLLDGIAEILCASKDDVVLDAGCGDGFYLGTLARQAGFSAHGVDISVPAIEAAARRYPRVRVDRGECRPLRALRRPIVLDRHVHHRSHERPRIPARPAQRRTPPGRHCRPDDLIELRGSGHDRTARTIQTFAHRFTLLEQRRVSTTADLDAAGVHDVLLSIYRPMQSRRIEAMRVTFSLDLLLFRRLPPGEFH